MMLIHHVTTCHVCNQDQNKQSEREGIEIIPKPREDFALLSKYVPSDEVRAYEQAFYRGIDWIV